MRHTRTVAATLLLSALTVGCPHRADGTADASSAKSAEGTGSPQVATGESAIAANAPGDVLTVDGGPATAEGCVDAWLAARDLDKYGSPKGTMYMGGTPLFDERTGERTDRLTFVYAKHPEAKAACSPNADR